MIIFCGALVMLGWAHPADASWSLGIQLLCLAGILLLIAAVTRIAKHSLPEGGADCAERKEATRLGLSVSDVERELPQFGSGNRSVKLVRGSCARYSLPRSDKGARSQWSLLQRTKHEGAQLPNGYLLQGEVSDDLRRDFTKLATELSEDYAEFEGTATEVSLYWEEWGGAARVQHFNHILKRLAGL